MNRIIAGVMLAGAIAASATPDAHADPAHDTAQLIYTVDLARAGITGPPYQEVVVGETICDNLAHGLPIGDTVTRLIPVAGTQIAITIVSAAVMDLCPQFTPSATTPAPATTPVPVTIAGAVRNAAIA